MAQVWKLFALLVVITALVWLTTLWRWQTAQHDPSPMQLLLHLALLPIVLTAALVGMVWGVKRLGRYAAAPVAAPAPKAAHAPAAEDAATTPPATVASRVLAASVQVRAGSDWKDAQSRIAAGDCKADLDKQMRDDDGIAVFTAPMDDLPTDAIEATLQEIASMRTGLPQDWAGEAQVSPELLRTLALLEMTVGEMSGALDTQWPVLAALPARSAPNVAPTLPPTVSIRVCVPARWPLAQQQLVGAWLHQLFDPLIDTGLQAAGQSRAMASSSRPAVQLHVHAVESAEAGWLLMEQQLQQWQRERQPGLLWALAADSLIGEQSVDALSLAGQLFTGRRQQGRVPGEAAAGLLLASPGWAPPADAPPPIALLHQASISRRDKSADASGRITPQALMQTVNDTLQAHALDAAQVAHVTTDADHRASRTAEVYETLQELLPHLDAAEEALRLGLGCGDLGVARLLTCAALSARQVQSSEAPGLVLGTYPAFERLTVLMTPATAAPATEAASAAATAAAA